MSYRLHHGSSAAQFSAMIVLFLVLGLSLQCWAKAIPESDGNNAFSLEEILYAKVPPFSARWISGTEIEYKNITTGQVMVYDTKDVKVLVEASVLKKYNCTYYKFSWDNRYLLMRYDDKENYRHSVISKYVVYSLKDKEFMDVAQKAHLQNADWIPRRNSIVFIKDNNIHFVDVKSVLEEYAITKTGVPGRVFNGVSDWAYEEEILGTGTSFTISSDGQQMVYLSIDDREVTEAQFMSYGEPGSLKDQYTTEVKIPYAKPGTTLGKYQLFHFNFTDRSTRLLSKAQPGREFYYGLNWVSNNSVAVIYSNRVQNVTETDLCQLDKGSCKKVYDDRNPKGWANFDLPLFSRAGDRYLTRVRVKVGRDEYYHIQLASTDGSRKTLLTNGTFMVRAIVQWDQASRHVYYRASEVDQPASDHVYVVSEKGNDKPFCITCQMTSPEGTACKSGSLGFNRNFQYVIGTCTGPNPRVVSVYSWTAPQTLKLIRVLDDNAAMRKILKGRPQPKQMDLRVKVTETIEADVRLLLPPNMDTSGKTKYPLIIYVYGGPDNPQVTDQFKFDWSWYFTTNRSVIYGMIDGRGTGRKGTEMMYAMYRVMGTVEMEDQRTATKYLRDNLNFIDKNRIGIWGWSYGGYATAKILEDDVEGVFKCGVSVAPVSDWIYYNAVYTERYMDSPANNPKGYRQGSLLYNVENMRKKMFLLMHGTGDDNVHYQHAMHLAKALQRKNIMFEQESYPDEAHGISGVKAHVYFTADRFWQRCFHQA